MDELSKLSDKELMKIEFLCQEIQKSRRDTEYAEKMAELREKYEGRYLLIGENLCFITAIRDPQTFEGVQLLQKAKPDEEPCYEFSAGVLEGLTEHKYSRTGAILVPSPLERATVITRDAALKYIDLIFSEIRNRF
ncbi:MAG: hypothetical protein IJI05_01415 [Erysipelotrichaceae bacterium]|nr:hypothetical protein [Erysipelotrichaceae bacterium]